MDTATFWTMIDAARAGAPDDDEFLDRLETALEALPPAEILAFDRQFDAVHSSSYSWNLWGAAYLIAGGCSDDGFDYFRAWLISQGRRVFEAAVADPDSLADLEQAEGELEELLYLAREVYEDKTGAEMPDPVSDDEYPELGEGWDFDDDAEMKRRYPRLHAKYAAGDA